MRDVGEVCDGVREVLSGASNDSDRKVLADRILAALNRELMRASLDDPDMACPACGGRESVRCGKTRAGTPRWKCKSCGKVRCHIDTGGILALSKLPIETWEAYIPLFLAHVSCAKIAKELDVTPKTAWFMRIRILEAVFNDLPAFQVKDGCGVQVDELYFRESFKGTRFDGMPLPPREARRGDGQDDVLAGISNDQICVVTAVNDTGDFFYDVTCRGGLTVELAVEAFENRILAGAVVNTDRHRAYPRAMEELKVASHVAIDSRCHEHLRRINEIHGNLRTFIRPFRGVSTKWLHLYLAWFKWDRCFSRGGDGRAIARKQIAKGDYAHTWRAIVEKMALPFRDENMVPLKRPRSCPLEFF